MSPAANRTIQGQATSARHQATQRLIQLHQDEFGRFYREERVMRGLPAEAVRNLSPSELRRERDEAVAECERLQVRLAEMEGRF